MAKTAYESFTPAEREEVLRALGESRKVLVTASERLRRNTIVRSGFETVVKNIDDLAMLLTGDSPYFHLKSH